MSLQQQLHNLMNLFFVQQLELILEFGSALYYRVHAERRKGTIQDSLSQVARDGIDDDTVAPIGGLGEVAPLPGEAVAGDSGVDAEGNVQVVNEVVNENPVVTQMDGDTSDMVMQGELKEGDVQLDLDSSTVMVVLPCAELRVNRVNVVCCR